MLDATLTQLLNELYRLTSSVQQAAQRIQELEQENQRLNQQQSDKTIAGFNGDQPSTNPV